MKNAAIVLAGGQGTRYGQQKQFIVLNGKPLWQHVHDKVSKFVDESDVCVVGVDVEGGATRSQSVINGLRYLANKGEKYSRLIILEAARPLITEQQIKDILEDGHPSCTFVLPLKSTVIMKDGTYLDRSQMWKMATPVAFDFKKFYCAYLTGKYLDFTDDTRVMYEEYGIKPFFLQGGENLLKLTYQSDLPVLESLMMRFSL